MFNEWIEQNHSGDYPTDVFGADADEIRSWLTQKFDPGERPEIMWKGTQYQVIGEPNMPLAKGKWIQVRPPGVKHAGGDKLIPVAELIKFVL